MKDNLVLALLLVISVVDISLDVLTAKVPNQIQYHKNPLRRWPALAHLRPKTSAEDQASTVTDMIVRLLGDERAANFAITVNSSLKESDRDVFIVDNNSNGTGISITASSGVAASMGFQYFAKNYCGCHFSWSGDQTGTMTLPLPVLSAPVKVVANDLFRYYQNVCTVSYSFVWWDWARWEREIDWMALNGINLPLAFSGQEEIWRRVYLALGFDQADLDQFFSGPAFLAWNRMGNLDGWGGPITEEYYQGQVQLQHKILDRMRAFGMLPVLPAFSGHVPSTIQKYYPNVTVSHLDDWNGFNATYCCTTLLDHEDPLFQTIGTNFITEMASEFGVDHVYNCDTFNEMEPPTTNTSYISGVGEAIFAAMVAADSKAVWMMQGWLFQDGFWTTDRAKALLLSVPIGSMIVLDLQSELSPQYQRLDSYFGQPWIWNMLHNFGGVKGLYGTVDGVNQGPFNGRAYPNSSMVGTGLTPEGIEQNDVMYALANEMAYLRVPVELDSWFSTFSQLRYGASNANVSEAWKDMVHTVLNCTSFTFHGVYVATSRPSLDLSSGFCYLEPDFLTIWDNFMEAATGKESEVASSDLFQHDLVDVSREALTVVATRLYGDMIAAFSINSSEEFRSQADRFLELLSDLDALLATDKRFLLGPWLASAKAMTTNATNAVLYEYNARNQITLWGPAGEIVDYATKQWSGIVSDYYLPRWRLFVDQVQLSLDSHAPFQQSQFNQDVLDTVETPFTYDTKIYPQEPVGNPIDVATLLYIKWRPSFPVNL